MHSYYNEQIVKQEALQNRIHTGLQYVNLTVDFHSNS